MTLYCVRCFWSEPIHREPIRSEVNKRFAEMDVPTMVCAEFIHPPKSSR